LKNSPINDLKQLWSDVKGVYPAAYAKIVEKWEISLVCFFAILSSFYLDDSIQTIVQNINNEIVRKAFDFGRWYGNGNLTLYLFIGLYVIGLVIRKYKIRDTGLLIGEAYFFSGIISLILKSVIGRYRPYMNLGDLAFGGFSWSDNDQFSFLSGHAQTSFALSAVLASTTDNILLKSFYYALAVLTSISRIYHNQHWFSDVVAGAIVAILITKVLLELRKVSPWQPENSIPETKT